MTEKEKIKMLLKMRNKIASMGIPYEGNEHLLGTTNKPE